MLKWLRNKIQQRQKERVIKILNEFREPISMILLAALAGVSVRRTCEICAELEAEKNRVEEHNA